MQNKKNTISDLVRAQILLESDDPKCVISKLASKHGVTANQIYNWRSKRRKQPRYPTTKISDKFVELVGHDLEILAIPIEYIQTEIKFAEFSFSIEGKISTKKLYKIIELMSSTC